MRFCITSGLLTFAAIYFALEVGAKEIAIRCLGVDGQEPQAAVNARPHDSGRVIASHDPPHAAVRAAMTPARYHQRQWESQLRRSMRTPGFRYPYVIRYKSIVAPTGYIVQQPVVPKHRGRWDLLALPLVDRFREQIEMSPDQYRRFLELHDHLSTQFNELRFQQGLGNLDPEAERLLRDHSWIYAEIASRLNDILSEEQRQQATRLMSQIAIHDDSLAVALVFGFLGNELEVTDDQRSEIAELARRTRGQLLQQLEGLSPQFIAAMNFEQLELFRDLTGFSLADFLRDYNYWLLWADLAQAAAGDGDEQSYRDYLDRLYPDEREIAQRFLLSHDMRTTSRSEELLGLTSGGPFAAFPPPKYRLRINHYGAVLMEPLFDQLPEIEVSLSLIFLRGVQQELDLVPGQVHELQDLMAWYVENHPLRLDRHHEEDPPALEIEELNKQVVERLREILLAHQHHRLQQLTAVHTLRAYGVVGPISSGWLAERLGTRPRQDWRQVAGRLAHLIQGITQRADEELRRQILLTLTAEQRQHYERLVGEYKQPELLDPDMILEQMGTAALWSSPGVESSSEMQR